MTEIVVNTAQPLSTTMESEEKKIRILGIDPGIISGFALLECQLSTRQIEWPLVTQVKIEQYSPFLDSLVPLQLSLISCEDFTLRPGKQTEFLDKGFTSLETAKLVGRTEQFAHTNQIRIVTPQASNKPFAYKLIGMTYVKGKKNMHKFDAKAHARHALRQFWSI